MIIFFLRFFSSCCTICWVLPRNENLELYLQGICVDFVLFFSSPSLLAEQTSPVQKCGAPVVSTTRATQIWARVLLFFFLHWLSLVDEAVVWWGWTAQPCWDGEEKSRRSSVFFREKKERFIYPDFQLLPASDPSAPRPLGPSAPRPFLSVIWTIAPSCIDASAFPDSKWRFGVDCSLWRCNVGSFLLLFSLSVNDIHCRENLLRNFYPSTRDVGSSLSNTFLSSSSCFSFAVFCFSFCFWFFDHMLMAWCKLVTSYVYSFIFLGSFWVFTPIMCFDDYSCSLFFFFVISSYLLVYSQFDAVFFSLFDPCSFQDFIKVEWRIMTCRAIIT